MCRKAHFRTDIDLTNTVFDGIAEIVVGKSAASMQNKRFFRNFINICQTFNIQYRLFLILTVRRTDGNRQRVNVRALNKVVYLVHLGILLLMTVIRASAKLGVNMVTTFIGRDQHKTVEENLELVKEIWPPILQLAEKLGVKIAIENCPMLFGRDQWPAGQNLMTSPANWKKVFALLPSENLGINYDPSHFVWQMMDYIAPIYEFKDKIFHVHYKDIKVYPDKLAQHGIMAYPLDFMAPKLPGLGDVNWSKFVSALTDIGYDGYTCIEVEDRAFEGSREKVLDSLRLSKRYMEQFVI